ncbi:MAG: ATP-binding protein [Cellulosilyticaceae bacterium]
MNSTAAQYKLLMQIYDKKRTLAASNRRAREEAIYKQIPDIEKIDRSINKIGISLLKEALSNNNGTDWIETSRERNEELVRLKKQLLAEYDYPIDYLDPQYECEQCQDTGFLNESAPSEIEGVQYFTKSIPCPCFKQALIDLAYRQSNLRHTLSTENFNTFSLNVYSTEVHPQFGQSPREHMTTIYNKAVAFTEYFDSCSENLLFVGPTGLGKTFLCNCIAKEILDKGYSVLYLSAQELFSLFQESRFHRQDMEDDSKHALATLFDVDLLVIDDFGTEVQNSFTAPDLFHVLNTRFLNQKSTIVSTNLGSKELRALYSDRIVSRLFGNYTVCRVFGDDVRLLKLKS